jgi:hypothetical protein
MATVSEGIGEVSGRAAPAAARGVGAPARPGAAIPPPAANAPFRAKLRNTPVSMAVDREP